jgi:23S rRNA (cytidine1920-2'-O)/16S rRNA (cytidine1409-2'-O)-methyltransferase
LPGPAPDLVTLDLAFISLSLVLPRVGEIVARPADVVALFKPQFELGRAAVGRGGIVRDPDASLRGLEDLLGWCRARLGAATPHDPLPAPIRGRKGNQEWLFHLVLPAVHAA